jgi:hypothetical protein
MRFWIWEWRSVIIESEVWRDDCNSSNWSVKSDFRFEISLSVAVSCSDI